MPRGDRTGPTGMGSKTGRGLGYCMGNEEPGYANPGFGYGGRRGGRGQGRGRGRSSRGGRWQFNDQGFQPGWGRIIPATPEMSAEQEVSWLESRVQGLKDSLEEMQARLEKLKE